MSFTGRIDSKFKDGLTAAQISAIRERLPNRSASTNPTIIDGRSDYLC